MKHKFPAAEPVFNVDDIYYRIGVHGFVYYLLNGEWIKSAMSKAELMRAVRNG